MKKCWDFIIVGTGIGGATLGYKLAAAGKSVLFIEKGDITNQEESYSGQFAELFKGSDRKKIFSLSGRSAQNFIDQNKRILHPLIGCGVGGSSALYGMALQRFKEVDFQGWPLSYQSFTKYYDEAETLYRVKSSTGHNHIDLKMFYFYLKSQLLNPYGLPLAYDDTSDCHMCQSFLCKKKCKNDASKIALFPAIENYNATLLPNTEVLKLETKGNRVTHVQVRRNDHLLTLRSRYFVLSAGALFTPILLLDSGNDIYPNGLGNDNGIVGRFLMRHLIDLYALRIDTDPLNHKVKELGFDDYYVVGDHKLGTVQSFGRLPPIEVILTSLGQQYPKIMQIARIIRPIFQLILSRMSRERLVFCSIIEDAPQFENRIWREEGKIHIHYSISETDKGKITLSRKNLVKLFKPFNTLLIKSAEKNELLAHACGTCRMGEDAKNSVVNIHNQVHGIENLFVVDSSFFPTSGGTNPALTIAANSIRISEYFLKRDQFGCI